MSASETPSKPYDEMSKQEQEEHDRAARAKEQEEQDGQWCPRRSPDIFVDNIRTALPYKWNQDLNTATVTVNLPFGTRARDLVVAIKKKSLKVRQW